MGRNVRKLFFAVVAAQLLFLVGLAGYHEVTLRTGQTVVLATVPVDPRDLFRGDYVILRYEITQPDPQAARFVLYRLNPGDAVYVRLIPEDRDGQEVWVASEVDLDPFDSGQVFIKGRVTGVNAAAPQSLQVEYGIESYFVPEGQGRDIERNRSILVRVSVNGFGHAVIKDLIIDGEVWEPR